MRKAGTQQHMTLERLATIVVAGFARVEERFIALEEQIDQLALLTAKQFTRIEERFEKIEARLEKLEEYLDKVELRVDRVEDVLRAIRRDMLSTNDHIADHHRRITTLEGKIA